MRIVPLNYISFTQQAPNQRANSIQMERISGMQAYTDSFVRTSLEEQKTSIVDNIAGYTFDDVLEMLEQVIQTSEFSEEVKSNYEGSLVTRIESLTNGINKIIFFKISSIFFFLTWDRVYNNYWKFRY